MRGEASRYRDDRGIDRGRDFRRCNLSRAEIPRSASKLGIVQLPEVVPDRPRVGIGFPPQGRMAFFKICVCNADRISPGCALPRQADELAQSAAQLSQWALEARFLWFVSGKPRGRSPPAASASAVRSVDPLALDADGADFAKPCAARRTNPTVWLLNSGLIRTAVDAMRFSTRAQLRGLAKISPPLRRELLQRRQARACLSNTPAGKRISRWLQGRFRTLTAHSSECATPHGPQRFNTARCEAHR